MRLSGCTNGAFAPERAGRRVEMTGPEKNEVGGRSDVTSPDLHPTRYTSTSHANCGCTSEYLGNTPTLISGPETLMRFGRSRHGNRGVSHLSHSRTPLDCPGTRWFRPEHDPKQPADQSDIAVRGHAYLWSGEFVCVLFSGRRVLRRARRRSGRRISPALSHVEPHGHGHDGIASRIPSRRKRSMSRRTRR